jgi:hypothetical protein
MIDLRSTIRPRSDQLNSDDLLVGPLTIKIVDVTAGDGDQPVSLHFEGDGGKPYKPCKSMRRVLVHCWGPDGKEYVGRSLSLYCDDKVQFGGQTVGGIRISHMSHIDKPKTMALTATRAQRKPFTVQPLAVVEKADKVAEGVRELIARIEDTTGPDEVKSILAEPDVAKRRTWLKDKRADLSKDLERAIEGASAPPASDFPGDPGYRPETGAAQEAAGAGK